MPLSLLFDVTPMVPLRRHHHHHHRTLSRRHMRSRSRRRRRRRRHHSTRHTRRHHHRRRRRMKTDRQTDGIHHHFHFSRLDELFVVSEKTLSDSEVW